MFYDLNVPWTATDTGLPRTLNFLHELGYNVVALNYSMTGKLPNELSCAIPNPLPYNDLPPKLEIRRRITLTLTDSLQNARLNALAAQYDILALRPVDEKTLQLACGSLDCDIISLDLSQRFQFHFKFKTLSEAIKLGKKIEICYGQGLLGDGQGRRNLISNVTQLIRATRARGLIISSEAKAAVACRGPWDAINLAAVWGLGQEKGYEAMTKEARNAVVGAQLKRTSFRGVVNVVYGGEKPTPEAKAAIVEQGKAAKQKAANEKAANGQKRKSDALGTDTNDSSSSVPMSKTQQKKRAKKEKMEAEGKGVRDLFWEESKCPASLATMQVTLPANIPPQRYSAIVDYQQDIKIGNPSALARLSAIAPLIHLAISLSRKADRSTWCIQPGIGPSTMTYPAKLYDHRSPDQERIGTKDNAERD